ncbi:MAG: hypothetical protein SPH79_03500 [Schaalia hyovaginalis]|uniref:hypothetical protein n=1 Tax=Schaalia hyovaginalis TaxID=29316 RepID=UPI002A91B306|nr:hypothetical protein [Schaalia hyovaginalis]MDY6213540.1 hypothetical protein [Schaalia hyovaginalis]
MTLSRSEARVFDASAYSFLAVSTQKRAQEIADTAMGLSTSAKTALLGWSGRAASAFASKLGSEISRAESLGDEYVTVASVIDWYGTALSTACANAVAAADAIESAGFDVDDQWQVTLSAQQKQSAGVGFLFVEKIALQTILTAKVNTIANVDANAVAFVRGSQAPSTGAGQGTQGDGSDTTSNGFTIGGEPDRTVEFDDHYPFESKKGEETEADKESWDEWGRKAWLAQLAPWLQNAADMYSHYRDGTGTPVEIDLAEASREDPSIRANTDEQISSALKAANDAVSQGYTDTIIHSPMTSATNYPETENWQKAIGGYTTYSDSRVTVEGDTVTVEVTVTARDRYNFDAAKSDIASGTPDAVNGRFEELGWARSFETTGTVTETYTWKVGDSPPSVGTGTGGHRERG